MDKNYQLRKRRVFFINEKLEKELGSDYTFDGIHIIKNNKVLKECSVWEKKVILKIYYDKIQKVEYETYQNLTQAEKDALNDTQDEIEVVEETITVDEKAKQNFEKQIESLQQQGLNTEEVQTPNFNLYNCKIKRTNTKGSIKKLNTF